MFQEDHWFPIVRLVVIEEASGRKMADFMMDAVSF